MRAVDFITMAGDPVQIPVYRLNEYDIKNEAEEHFKQPLICTPCLFGAGTVAVGWHFISKCTAKTIGFMTLVTGEYSDYPDDFEYGVNIVIPLSKMWTKVFNYQLRYISDSIEIDKCP